MQAKECAYAKDMAGLATECEACLPTFIAMGDGKPPGGVPSPEDSEGRGYRHLFQARNPCRTNKFVRCFLACFTRCSQRMGNLFGFAKPKLAASCPTMNFYHMNANREVWDRFSALTSHVQEIVAGAAEFCEAEEQ